MWIENLDRLILQVKVLKVLLTSVSKDFNIKKSPNSGQTHKSFGNYKNAIREHFVNIYSSWIFPTDKTLLIKFDLNA